MTQLNNSIDKENNSIVKHSIKPLVDVYENDEGMVFLADIPGVDTEHLDLQVEGNVLSIEGQLVSTSEPGAKKDLQMVPDGVYKRSFNLREGLDFDNIDAELKSGLLTIKVPNKAVEVPKKVLVRAA